MASNHGWTDAVYAPMCVLRPKILLKFINYMQESKAVHFTTVSLVMESEKRVVKFEFFADNLCIFFANFVKSQI